MLKQLLFNYWNKIEEAKKSDDDIHPKTIDNNAKKDTVNVIDEDAKSGKKKRWGIIIMTIVILGALITILVFAFLPTESKAFGGKQPSRIQINQDTSKPDSEETYDLLLNDDKDSNKVSLPVSNGTFLKAYQVTGTTALGTTYQIYYNQSTYFELTVVDIISSDAATGSNIQTHFKYSIGSVDWIIDPEGKVTSLANIYFNDTLVDLTVAQQATAIQNFSNAIYKTLTSVKGAPVGFDWLGYILSFLPFVIYILFFVIIYKAFKKQSGAMGGGDSIFGFGKSQDKMVTTNIKFVDVAGIKEEKNELIEIVDYLQKPQKYAEMGARTPRGVMLYGPPGTGKTLLAKAVAGEAGVPFFQVSGSAFDDMLVGSGAKRVRDLFSKARKAAPAIIFIDEIDSVAAKRGRNEIVGGGGGIADQTINQLLAEMDGFNTESGIVIIAATNRLDVLDDALLRPGRFDRQVQITLPDIKERLEILQIHARNKNISARVDLEEIARRTPGFSGAQLENVLNEATLLAVRNDRTVVKLDDIDEAIDRTIGGPAKTSKVVSADEKKQIAYHEAGHALIGLFCEGADVVQKITIIPRGNAAGYTMQTPKEQELSIQKKSDLLDIVRTTLGGRVAEEVVYGHDAISTGASNDFYKITNIVRAMVMQLGMTDVGKTQFVPSEGSQSPYAQKLYSETTALKIDQEIERIIETEYQKAIKIITDNRKELDLIVETLLILETIVKSQIDYIHEKLELPPEAIKQLKKQEESAKKAAEANVDESETIAENKVINDIDSSTKSNE